MNNHNDHIEKFNGKCHQVQAKGEEILNYITFMSPNLLLFLLKEHQTVLSTKKKRKINDFNDHFICLPLVLKDEKVTWTFVLVHTSKKSL